MKKITMIMTSLFLLGIFCLKSVAASSIFDYLQLPTHNEVYGAIQAPIPGEYANIKTGPVLFANRVISLLTGIAFVWLLIVIIYNGIKIITGSKSAEVLVASTRSILLSITGIILVAMAYYITSWVSLRLFGSSDYFTDPLKNVPTVTDG